MIATDKKKKIDLIEELVLRWPDGAERTRIKERKSQSAWKFTWGQYRDLLERELSLLGATSILISRSDKADLDPGVAVWFSMAKEDFSWQQGLGIETPAPTLDQIDQAYRTRAKPVHPDNQTGTADPEMFKRLTEWRDAAKAWVRGTHKQRHEGVMAIDQYDEPRLNLCAIRLAFSHIRGLERVGAPAILKQTLSAFRAKLVAQTGGAASTGGTAA
jgi:hypothetical protein